MRLHNDYADIEHKLKNERPKHELYATVAIPFHEGYDILARTITSLTQQTYSKDSFEVIIVADANYADAKSIAEQYKNEIEIKLVADF